MGILSGLFGCNKKKTDDKRDETSSLISNQELSEADLAWNAIIDYWIQYDLDELSENQRLLAVAFWFDADVQNGGLGQYFHNKGFKHIPDLLKAIEYLSASKHEALITEAISLIEVKYGEITLLSHDQAQEIDDIDFDDLDTQYFQIDALTYIVEEEFKSNRDKYKIKSANKMLR